MTKPTEVLRGKTISLITHLRSDQSENLSQSVMFFEIHGFQPRLLLFQTVLSYQDLDLRIGIDTQVCLSVCTAHT